MEYLTLNATRVAKLGLGTWQMNGSACTEAVRDALELGYRHIDIVSLPFPRPRRLNTAAPTSVASTSSLTTTR